MFAVTVNWGLSCVFHLGSFYINLYFTEKLTKLPYWHIPIKTCREQFGYAIRPSSAMKMLRVVPHWPQRLMAICVPRLVPSDIKAASVMGQYSSRTWTWKVRYCTISNAYLVVSLWTGARGNLTLKKLSGIVMSWTPPHCLSASAIHTGLLEASSGFQNGGVLWY